MQDLQKVTSIQFYRLWKNLSIGMLTIIAMLMMSKLLPFYLSPVVALIAAAGVYTYIYENKRENNSSCLIIPFAVLYSLVGFSFVTIGLNVFYVFGATWVPDELVIFTVPVFLPTLLMNPVCFIVFLWMYIRHRKMAFCRACQVNVGSYNERGTMRHLLSTEIPLQLKNLTILFGVLTAIIWGYYTTFYIDINVNERDWYIFFWLTLIAFILDEVYFAGRYYNLYLDLRENDELISQEELNDMTAKTYLRYYVICGNSIYVSKHSVDPRAPYKEVIDTPFFTKRPVNGIAVHEVRNIIDKLTGVDNGELRFFFGRKIEDMNNHSVLRYFYFLDGSPSDYPELATQGEWMDFDRLKHLYSSNPGKLSEINLGDITRLATIMLTEKTFDEDGYRKSKIRMYNPSFDLNDVRKLKIDFQDDKWIYISMFNSDQPFYTLKRKWKKFIGSRKSNSRNSLS